jgi:hypothetical protein
MRLPKMMLLRRAYLPQPMTTAATADLLAARDRCARCYHSRLCDEVLASGRSEGYGLFCPNTHYIEHLRGNALRFS